MADLFSSLRDTQRNLLGQLDEFLADIEDSGMDEDTLHDMVHLVEAAMDSLDDMPWPADA